MSNRMKLICAATTPFDDDGALDRPGLAALLRHTRESGVEHVFTPGTTAEFTTLTDDERLAVIDEALAVFGPEGTIAHVGAAGSRQAVALARAARARGARRLAAITPYFVTAGPVSVQRYYRDIAEAVPDALLYAYVFPARATTTVSPETLAALAEIPQVAGAKLSGMPTAEVERYLAAVPDGFEIFSGNDREVVRLAAAGGAGIVSGVSGVFPEVFVRAVAALNDGADASVFQDEIDSAVEAVAGGDAALLKAGLRMRGLPAGPLRVATEPATRDRLARLRDRVAAERTGGLVA